MKLIVTIALLVVAGAALIDAKGPPEFMAQFKECMESNGLDPKQGKEIFKKLHSGQDLEGDEKKNFGCANKCMMEKQGVWKDGK
uniref:Uncharacterized protein n=1 Tax=Megaselia scalaris TaxID=36166 RepID=T1H224_MEGSC